MRRKLVGFIVLIALYANPSTVVGQWPKVVPATQTFHISLPLKGSPVSMTIDTGKSTPAYRIECGTYDSSIAAFDYSGEFECLMQTVPPNYKYSTLFTEDTHQHADWESRARFFAKELIDPCGAVPDFGRIRTFRLRGMKVTLAISNIVFSGSGTDQKLQSFDFVISVRDDPAAIGNITQSPLLLESGITHHAP